MLIRETLLDLNIYLYFQYLESIGYCPQNDSLNHILTGREILTTVANLRGINDTNVIENFLELFGMYLCKILSAIFVTF